MVVFFIKRTPQEKVIRECLGHLYNISDYTIINQINKGLYEIIEAADKLNPPQKGVGLKQYPEANEYLSFGYDKYCTERVVNQMSANGWHMFYRKIAYNKEFTVELKDISLEKYFEFKDEKKIAYNFKVTLIIDYVNTDKVETVYEKGYVNVVKVNNEWRIDGLGVKELGDVFLDDMR